MILAVRTVEGVEGKGTFTGVAGVIFVIREVDGVEGRDAFAGVEVMALVGFVRHNEEGVIGKGIAKSFAVRLLGVILDFVEDEREGEGGASKDGVCADFGDLGDSDTSRWVKADCFVAGGAREGRFARGTFGIGSDLLCNYTGKQSEY